MSIYDWNDRFSIDIPQIDQHHQHLFFLLNKTYNSYIRFADEDLNPLFIELIGYATYHFSAEEKFMEESKFPGLEGQKKEHAMFSEKIVEMHKEYQNGKKSLALELLSFLYTWLSAHILQSDAEYGRFIALNKKE
jgi:hemerythrin